MTSNESVIGDQEVDRGKKALVWDAAWASTIGILAGGVVLVDFALELGATPFQIGLLAAIPFLGQFAQLPAIYLVQHFRRRRILAVGLGLAERVVIMLLALLPLLTAPSIAIPLLIISQLAVAALAATSACAWNSWMHDFLPRPGMGAFFSRRLFWGTSMAFAAGILGGMLIDNWPGSEPIYAYSVSFLLAAIAGFISSWYLSRVPEPPMHEDEVVQPPLEMLRQPLIDKNFRRLIRFLAAFNLATNFAGPFTTVFLLQYLGFDLATVMILWGTSQAANAMTVRLWGNLSDRFSNKAVLRVTVPAFFTCLLVLPFTAHPTVHAFTIPMLIVVHVMMGLSSGGSGLAIANIGLRLAPRGQGTAYLATVSLLSAAAAAVAPVAGGMVLGWFASRELSIVAHLGTPDGTQTFSLVDLAYWDFFFIVVFCLGLYAMHRLSLVEEGQEAGRRVVVQNLAMEARRTMRSLSSVGGMRLSSAFPFGRILRRKGDPNATLREQEEAADQSAPPH